MGPGMGDREGGPGVAAPSARAEVLRRIRAAARTEPGRAAPVLRELASLFGSAQCHVEAIDRYELAASAGEPMTGVEAVVERAGDRGRRTVEDGELGPSTVLVCPIEVDRRVLAVVLIASPLGWTADRGALAEGAVTLASASFIGERNHHVESLIDADHERANLLRPGTDPIHDDVLQVLFGVATRLDSLAVDPSVSASVGNELADLAEGIGAAARRLSELSMRPPAPPGPPVRGDEVRPAR